MPNVEEILAPYAEKSYGKYVEKYRGLGLDCRKAEDVAMADIKRDMEQASRDGNINLIPCHPAVGIIRLSL